MACSAAVGNSPDDDAGQAVGALQTNQRVAEDEHAADQDAGAVRYQVAPAVASMVRDRRLGDLEVLGAVGVGEDHEAVPVVGNLVPDAVFARRHQAQGCVGIVGVEDAHLRRGMVVAGNNDEASARGLLQAHVEAGVGLLVDHGVGGRIVAQAVAADLRRAVVFVEHRVIEGAPVVGPGHVAVGVVKVLVQGRSGS